LALAFHNRTEPLYQFSAVQTAWRREAERGEALKLAVLVLLEKLSPTEHAAYVLREAFDYPYRQIADILQMEEANVRQLVFRARKHIADSRRTPVSSDEQRRFLEAFIGAAQKGDLAGLEGLFAEDVVSYSDGGILDGRLVDTEGFHIFGGPLPSIGHANEVHALWDGVHTGGAVDGGVALRGLVRRHIRRCEGIAVWFAYGSFRRMHPPDFQSCHYEHGYETRAGNRSK
jgi:hypothetical protein